MAQHRLSSSTEISRVMVGFSPAGEAREASLPLWESSHPSFDTPTAPGAILLVVVVVYLLWTLVRAHWLK